MESRSIRAATGSIRSGADSALGVEGFLQMSFRVSFLWFAVVLTVAAQQPEQGCFADSAASRWLNKKVLASRVLDDMGSPANWAAFTTGAPEVVDARTVQKAADRGQSAAEMSLSRERSREGRPSLRMRLLARLDGPGPKNGRGWGSAGVRREFGGEDWRAFNRLSLWIYPDCVGVCVVALELRLYNEGAERLPAAFGQEGETTVVLHNHEWNHAVWEIGNVARDRVTRFEVSGLMSGHEPEAAETLTYDLDHLELQQVEPDYIEGWRVWPGRIAYSHAGYQLGATKNAMASGVKATQFRLLEQKTGKAALSKALLPVKTPLGEFQLMDFSEVRTSGRFVLEAGDVRTQPFCIGPEVWRQTILKALNFLYAERCGMAVPGVHGICHRDWTVSHGDQRIIINGGWHDAGDLTQGLENTAELVYGLFSLAERVRVQSEDAKLCQRVLDEACWGLDWVLKTSFGDGYRDQGSVSSRWTDGIIGTSDDISVTARNSPIGNFTASAAEAIAARVLKESDPRLAALCLRVAEQDWQFAHAGMASTNSAAPKGPWRGTFDSDNVEHEVAAMGVLAAVDLWRVTRRQQYAAAAAEMAETILACQARKRPQRDVPLVGFFYTSPAKDRLLHYCHRGREHVPLVALSRLCEAFPDHPDWMKWYSAAALYAQYLKTAAAYNAPYGVMSASIYQEDEWLTVPETRRDSFRAQVLNGIPLGGGHYLRRFPVWMDYRGHFGTILPQAIALLAAAHLRGDLDAVTLAQHQAEWIVGRNPFAQSTMYGEGYDFPPLYAPFPGDIAGALPVGIQTRGERDVPYWPVQSTWTYKEVWVHPVACWIWLMSNLAGPAIVEGEADGPVDFIATGARSDGVSRAVPAQGRFRVLLPEGKYTVRFRREEQVRAFLPSGRYHLDLRAGRSFDYEAAKLPTGDGLVRIRVTARGSGRHRFRIRTDNISLAEEEKELVLRSGAVSVAEWQGTIYSPDAFWTAVVIADGDPTNRKELMGAAWEQ